MDKRGVEQTLGITQDGMSPCTMRCIQCGEEWQPKPNRKGDLTDAALDRSAKDHWQECEVGTVPGAVVQRVR